MSRYRHHIFVCTHRRPTGGKPSCAAQGSDQLAAALQRAITSNSDLVGTVAVTATACLGPCFDGPNLVIYPDATWYAHVTPADVDDLVATHLLTGHPLTRLLYTWPDDDD